jgi:hypothetical protein
LQIGRDGCISLSHGDGDIRAEAFRQVVRYRRHHLSMRQLRTGSRRCTMKSINDLIASATMYRAENVVVDPLVGRNPVIALSQKSNN